MIDILFYLGMAALAFLGVGTLLSLAHVALPAWFTLALSWGWLLIVLGVPLWLIAPWLTNVLRTRR